MQKAIKVRLIGAENETPIIEKIGVRPETIIGLLEVLESDTQILEVSIVNVEPNNNPN